MRIASRRDRKCRAAYVYRTHFRSEPKRGGRGLPGGADRWSRRWRCSRPRGGRARLTCSGVAVSARIRHEDAALDEISGARLIRLVQLPRPFYRGSAHFGSAGGDVAAHIAGLLHGPSFGVAVTREDTVPKEPAGFRDDQRVGVGAGLDDDVHSCSQRGDAVRLVIGVVDRQLQGLANFDGEIGLGEGIVFEYIEAFYNRVRRHSTLDYHSPHEYERLLDAG